MAYVFEDIDVNNTISGGGIPLRASVRATTTTNGSLASAYANGSSIDGVLLTTNDRILIKDQSVGTENGIYIIQAAGAPVRADDYGSGISVHSTLIVVDEGTLHKNTIWICTNNEGSAVVDTDALFYQNIVTGGAGDVSGPASSTDNTIVRFDGITGKVIQGSNITINDIGDLIITSSTTSLSDATGALTVVGGISTQENIFAGNVINGNSIEAITDVDTPLLLTDAISENTTSAGITLNHITYVDQIAEKTVSNGVRVDDLILSNGNILDVNNNELINFSPVSSAVNELTVSNAITAQPPTLSATGDDTNIDLLYKTKGSGVHVFDSDVAAEIRLRDATGTEYIGLRPTNATTSYTLVFPGTQGGSGEVLQNNGSGVLSWTSLSPETINTITTSDNNNITIATIPTTTNITYFIEVSIVARRTDVTGESAGYAMKSTYRNDGGILTRIGRDDRLSQEDNNFWRVRTTTSGTNINIQVRGQTGKTVNWKSSLKFLTV